MFNIILHLNNIYILYPIDYWIWIFYYLDLVNIYFIMKQYNLDLKFYIFLLLLNLLILFLNFMKYHKFIYQTILIFLYLLLLLFLLLKKLILLDIILKISFIFNHTINHVIVMAYKKTIKFHFIKDLKSY
jgi:hypothetical protein